ncbi:MULTISPECIES: transglycosylase domain-containing protein [unclassified Streptomyces]|uniref:transglycosylase domain-containing protein n=1 Tax=unclassified Streptomyces TaxID=2593676 RepID=UPI00224E4238|nr:MULTISPECIES: transglycosylase domain-containing protein [unclassified Streptomyces]MCX4527215.1 transglycosylase domain-containing protein [Streptomyces sp. NBC_01551]MCX4542208.1 transglycosylase domain-containing protein [Streptomyces sp. NBC_01565]
MGKKRSGGGLTGPQQAAKFLGVSVLSGVVLAGIAIPGAGALGLAAKGTVEGFDEIPANLKTPPLSQRTTILDAEGGLIATVYSRDRQVVPLTAISPYMQKAIVAIEDSRFYEHGAVDLKGILRAVNRNAQEGGAAQGASTLTQQYVKNVFVEEAGDDETKVREAQEKSLGRKVRELKYSIQVEEELGKKKILENYLNITYFGQQAYGIESAAQRYFSKPAKDLTLDESALLAGLVQSPSRYDPVNDAQEALKRRNTVLQRMADVKDISQAEADAAKAKPVQLKVTRPKNGCITAVKGAGFFCDYVRNSFLTDAVFGKTREERAKIWNQGGLTIRTTLDPQSQEATNASIKDHVYQDDSIATAMTMVQPGTGRVLAMGQSKPYGFGKNETQINYSVDKRMGGSNFGFQVGSTFKPFIAAAALEQGMPATKVYSAPNKIDYPSPIARCDGTQYTNNGRKRETAENETEDEVGPYALRTAMEKSINTYFVQMIDEIGLCPVTEMTQKLGVVPASGVKLPESPSIALGSAELSPLTMANAYATFANRGVYCTPVAIESITDSHGKALSVPKSKCDRAMSETTADTINTLLLGVVDSGTGEKAGLSNRDSAGKTGTTDSRYNAWFVGYTPNVSGAVWVGSGGAKKISMENITIGGQYYPKVFGGGLPGPIWKDAVSDALSGREAPQFATVHIAEPSNPNGGGRPTSPNPTPNKPGKPGKPGGGGGDNKPGGRPGGATNAGATNGGGANGGAGGTAGTGGTGGTGGNTLPGIPGIPGVTGGRDTQ